MLQLHRQHCINCCNVRSNLFLDYNQRRHYCGCRDIINYLYCRLIRDHHPGRDGHQVRMLQNLHQVHIHYRSTSMHHNRHKPSMLQLHRQHSIDSSNVRSHLFLDHNQRRHNCGCRDFIHYLYRRLLRDHYAGRDGHRIRLL